MSAVVDDRARWAAPASTGRPVGPALEPAIVGDVRRRLVADGLDPTPARVAEAAVRIGAGVGSAVLDLSAALVDELVGAGPLTPLLATPGVTDVLVNGPAEVWCDSGDGLRLTGVRFPDEAAVRRLAERLAAQAGRRLDDAVPFADVRLPGGARLHAVLPPVSVGGTLLSLRVPRQGGMALEEMVASGSLPPATADLLRAVVAARLAFLVTGGTGSGKTTMLAALLGAADPRERVVVVEETPELWPRLPHVVHLQARGANAEGAGAVPPAALVRQTLRMRPDRLVVGEVRGDEVVDLLRALNSGHDGGCGTLHANSGGDVPARVEALAVGAGLDRIAAHSLLAAAVQLVVHLVRGPDGVRRVAEVAVLRRAPDGTVRAEPAWPEATAEPGARAALGELLAARGVRWPG
ncbi:MAG: TadA family conjugal transfer-associated ATPase [Frankiaceae bacterium]